MLTANRNFAMMPCHGRTIRPNAFFFCYGRAENAYILKVERNYYEFLCALDYALVARDQRKAVSVLDWSMV
jgi:hypothetical protein